MKTTFKVGQVSTQINSNHWAWATNVAEFDNKKEADKYASELWSDILDAADQAGTNYIGEQIITNY